MKTGAVTRREEQCSLCTSLRSRIILHQDDDFFVCGPVSGSLGLSSSDSDADGAEARRPGIASVQCRIRRQMFEPLKIINARDRSNHLRNDIVMRESKSQFLASIEEMTDGFFAESFLLKEASRPQAF